MIAGIMRDLHMAMVAVGFALTLCCGITAGIAFADLGPLTPQESYVMERVRGGQVADLQEKFGPGEKGRTIRGSFLAALLFGKVGKNSNSRERVWLKHAIIAGPLEITASKVSSDIRWGGCRFLGAVVFQGTLFEKNLTLTAGRFDEEANFSKIEVKGDTDFSGTRFSRKVKFDWAKVDKSFNLRGVTATADADFSGLTVGQYLEGEEAYFGGQVFFRSVKVNYMMYLNDAIFRDEVNCRNLKVGTSLYLKKTYFYGKAGFEGTEITRDLEATGSQFLHPQFYASFPGMTVGKNANFEKAEFRGRVDFGGAEIGQNLNMKDGKFLFKDKDGIYFSNLKVGDRANFVDVRFKGQVNFAGSDIKGIFEAAGVHFESGEDAIFNGIKVGQLVDFSNSNFGGPVILEEATIGNKLVANAERGFVMHDASPHPQQISPHYQRINLKRAKLSNLIIGSAPRLNQVDGDLEDTGPDDSTTVTQEEVKLCIDRLDLDGAVVEEEFTLRKVEVQKFHADGLKVKGKATFNRVDLKEEADLRDSNFFNLQLINVTWPRARANGSGGTRLGGLTFQNLGHETAKEQDWGYIFTWLNISRPDRATYLQFKEYFERIGQGDQANRVYVAMMEQEPWLNQWWDVSLLPFMPIWGWLLGYGRYPFRLLLLAIPIIVLGTMLFKTEELQGVSWSVRWTRLKRWEREVTWLKKGFMLFLLSLEKFTPGVDLGLEKRWECQGDSYWRTVGLYLLRLSGWILIPIFLAAIYTKFK